MLKSIVAVLLVSVACGGCAVFDRAKGPACQVIDLADSVCKMFVFPDGERVKLSPEDTRDMVRMQAAMKAGGSKDCK